MKAHILFKPIFLFALAFMALVPALRAVDPVTSIIYPADTTVKEQTVQYELPLIYPIAFEATATPDIPTNVITRVDLLAKLSTESVYHVVDTDLTKSNTVTGYVTTNPQSIGDTTILINTGTGAIAAGDIVTFEDPNNPGKYTVGPYRVASVVGATTSITINAPGLLKALPAGVGVNVTPNYSFLWTPSAAGIYTVKTRAVENTGATADSDQGGQGLLTAVITNAATAFGPTLAFTTPTANFNKQAGTTQTLTVSATALNGKTIQKVDFYAGTSLLSTVTTGPYTFNWAIPVDQALVDTVITATVTDSAGLTNSVTLIATITAPATVPSVNFTAPVVNTQLQAGTVQALTVTGVSYSNRTIQNVQFLSGTTVLGTLETPTSGTNQNGIYTYNWLIPNTLTLGATTLTAILTDSTGATIQTTRDVTITAPASSFPTVSLSAPSATVTLGSSLSITATATAGAGAALTQVSFNEYYRSVNVLTRSVTDTTTPYGYEFTPTQTGTYYIKATATNDQGNSAVSSVLTLTVTASAAVPTVAYVSPATVAMDLPGGLSRLIQVSATAPVGRTIQYVEFWVNGSRQQLTASPSASGYYEYRLTAPSTIINRTPGQVIGIRAIDSQNASSDMVEIPFAYSQTAPGATPTVKLLNPTTSITLSNGSTQSGLSVTDVSKIKLYATAFKSGGTVARVRFTVLQGRAAKATATVTPYSAAVGGTSPSPEKGGQLNTVTVTDSGIGYLDPISAGVSILSGSATAQVTNPTTVNGIGLIGVTYAGAVGDYKGAAPSVLIEGQLVGEEPFKSPYVLGDATPVTNSAGERVWEIDLDPQALGMNPTLDPDENHINEYYIKIEAFDTQGRVNTFLGRSGIPALEVKASISNPPTVPVLTVSTTTPTVGQVVGLSATSSDPDGMITSIAFYSNGVLVGTADTTSPYESSWMPPGAGTYKLTAVATDDTGNQIASAPTSIIVAANVVTGLAPAVSVLQPVSGTTITTASSLLMTANAYDADGSIAAVEFYANGRLLGTATRQGTSTTYVLPLNLATAGLAPGAYSVVARATDNLGNFTMSTAVPITVIGATVAAPTVTLSAPTTTVVANQSIDFTATPVVFDSSVPTVSFYVNGVLLKTVTQAPYIYTFKTSLAGIYTLVAVATDSFGSTATSSSQTLTVSPSVPPTVTLAAPVPTNASLGRPVVLQATASSNVSGVSITQVDFYANGILINSDTAAPYSYSYTPQSSGNYTITAVATDSLGFSTTSAAQTLTVTPVVGIAVQADLLNADAPLTKVATGTLLILTVKTTPGNSAVQTVVVSATNSIGTTVTLGQATQISGTNYYQLAYVNALPFDQYQVFATVTDANGNVARTGQRAIQSVAATASSVTIQSPGNNQTLAIAETLGFVRATADPVVGTDTTTFFGKKINAITVTNSGLGYTSGSTATLEIVNDSVYASAFGTPIISRTYTLPLTLDGQGRVLSISLTGVGDTSLQFYQTARITIPDNFGGSSTVPVTLGVTAPAGVSSLSLYANGQLVGSVTNSPYVVQWSPTFAGTYQLHAELVDSNGVLTSSSVYTIIVAPVSGYLDSIAVGDSTVYKLVNNFYGTLLVRSINKTEIAALNAKFTVGMSDEDIRFTLASIAADLVNTDSFRTEGANVILYNMVALQRLPTLAEYQTGLAAIQSGGAQSYLLQLLTGNEYKQKFGAIESILTSSTGQYNLVKPVAIRVYQGAYGVLPLGGTAQNLLVQNFMNRIAGLVPSGGNGPSLVAQAIVNYLADQRSGTSKELVENRLRVVGLSYMLRDGTAPTFAEIAARQKISTITIADNFLNNAPLTEGKPIITLQPVGATLPMGQSLLLTIAVRATPHATLQWYRNGAPILGATSVSYLASVGGQYTLKATNTKGAVTSRAATVVIVPQAPTVPVGGISVDLGVSAGTSISNGLAGMEYYGKGLPTGLSINKTTGEIIGLVSARAKLGSYTVSVWSQSNILKSAVQTFTLVVQPYPAAFKGNKDSGSLTNGISGTFGSVSITVSSTGAYTGRLVKTDLTSYTIRGTMVATSNNASASSTVTIPGLGGLQLSFNNAGVLGATLTVGAVVYTN